MRFIRTIGMILGSLWFLFGGWAVGTFFVAPAVLPFFNTRDVGKGEQLHSWFSVVAEPGDIEGPFQVVRKDNLEPLLPHSDSANVELHFKDESMPISFLMPNPMGRIESEYRLVSYRVVEDLGDEQIIELEENLKKARITIWSVYKARSTSISPLSSRVSNFRSDMFISVPIAFCGALAFFLIGRFILLIT